MQRWVVLQILLFLSFGNGIVAVHFLPYGESVGDTVLTTYDESSSQEIQLSSRIHFYGTEYRSVFVNSNGLLSFGTEIPFYRNVHLKDLGFAVIAIFYADIDTQDRGDVEASIGTISYREEVNNAELRTKVSKFIEVEYKDATGFDADALFVVTWDKVGYYQGKRDKRVSVQLLLASNSSSTYTMLQYKDVGWVRGEGKQAPEMDIPAQAGFVAQDHRFQMLIGSGTIDMNKMPSLSNVKKPGLFTFRISGEMPVDPRSLKMGAADDQMGASEDAQDEYDEEEYDYDEYMDQYGDMGGVYDEYTEYSNYYDDSCAPMDEDACPPATCYFVRDENRCLRCECNRTRTDGRDRLQTPTDSGPPIVQARTVIEETKRDEENLEDAEKEDVSFSPVDCRDTKNVGYVCDEAMATIRWAYSEQRDRCLAFSYKGCGGNGNNFRNKMDCEARCRPADGPVCSGALLESGGNAMVADRCSDLNCPQGKICRMGAFYASCCDENKERYYTQLVSPICPNGQEADTSVEAESCADEPCAASIGFQCVQVNPFFAKCCAKDVANYKAHPEQPTNQVEAAPPLMRYPPPPPAPGPPPPPPAGSASCDVASGPNCDANGECVSGNGGSCCRCNQGYYGNGQLCLKKDDPQRINGRFSGVINGHRIDESDLHTYVVTSDGRSYTALSQIPDHLGSSLQFLYTIGGVMGWLFAEAKHPHVNGFQLTGGYLNRTATVHVGSDHSVTINQQFSGRHIQDYLKATVFISGTLPNIPKGTQLSFGASEFIQEYRIVQPGVIKSYNTQKVTVANDAYDITIDQTIKYNPCPFSNAPPQQTHKLKITQSYVQHAPEEKILRYASRNIMQSASEPAGGSCSGRQCSSNADCYPVPQGRSDEYECVCRPGYTGDGVSCTMDNQYPEQPDNSNTNIGGPVCRAHTDCHANGECKYNDALRQYQCICRPPYSGDGTHCFLEAETCDVAFNCGANAECVLVRTEIGEGYQCRCRSGFSGDGQTCAPTEITQSCEISQNCDRFADCVFERTDNGDEYRCRCKSGYSGDGYRCNPLTTLCRAHEDCHANGECRYNDALRHYQCQCRPPYTGDGKHCLLEAAQVDCSTMNNCHPQAQCVYQPSSNGHICQCMSGFTGDGYVCMDTRPTMTRKQCTDNSQCHPSGQCIQMEEGRDFFCHCQYGFKGDGFNRCDPVDECAVGSTDCAFDAECLFNENEMAYLCVCNPGFYGDGKRCAANVPGRPAIDPTRVYVDCRSDPDQCVAHATCAPDYTTGGYVCQCEVGYSGDPYSVCSKQNEVGCVTHGNCDSNADCVYNSEEDKHECVCRNGFRGDGYFCKQSSQSCYDDRELCNANADCLPSAVGYMCICANGYHGNGFTCAPDSELRGQAIVYAQGMALVQRGMQPGEQAKQLVVVSQQTAVGVDYDCQEDRIFWTDIAGHALRSSTLEGDNVTVIIEDDLRSPEGIAIDWKSRNVYYADSMLDVIGVVSIDSKQHKVLLEGLRDPRALELDLKNKKLYYSDWYREAPVIGRMSLDGSDREDFLTYDIGIPNDLTVLHAREELCWADAGAQQQRLDCIGLDGRNRRTVYSPLRYPFGLTHHQETTFYWTDWNDNLVHSVSINGQNYRKFKPDFPANAKPYGIVAIPTNCPVGDSPCAVENGGCPYLCLPNSRDGVTCACPDNLDQDECNKVEQLFLR